MSDLRPATAAVLPHDADDPRVGGLIGTGTQPDHARAVLVGFPCDEGVRRNGGRAGAAGAPEAIRRALWRLTPDPDQCEAFTRLLRETADLGDVTVSGDLEADQERLGQVLAPHLARGAVALVLGGGHETAYGHFLGYVHAGRPVTILNWDAHPDVRVLKDGLGHSGSPFRQALEHPSALCAGYHVAGLNRCSVARAHLDELQRRGGRYWFNDDVDWKCVDDICARLPAGTMTTFDLDAVDQSAAPGVSAPAVGGLSVDVWLWAAFQSGACPHVTSFDVVELSPRHDHDGRTARLAARTVWEFLRGLAGRLYGEPVGS